MEIQRIIRGIFTEHLQLADKNFFKTGRLSPKDREIVIGITGGDAYTNLVTDLYDFLKTVTFKNNPENFYKYGTGMVNDFYKQVINYDKNVFPVARNIMDYGQDDTRKHIIDLVEMLRERDYAINNLKKLPSIAIRNLKKLIRTPANSPYYFKDISSKLRELNANLKILPKKDEKKYNAFLGKIFASSNDFNAMVDIAQRYADGFNVVASDTPKDEIIDNVNNFNAEVIQDSKNVLVIRVDDSEAMSHIGCTSQWCFAVSPGGGYWEGYAPNGHAYVIYDFNKEYMEALFLMVLLPDSGSVYASTNVPIEDLIDVNSNDYLKSIGVNVNKIYSDFHKQVDMKKPQSEPVDTRQLQMQFAENDLRNLIRTKLLEDFRYLYDKKSPVPPADVIKTANIALGAVSKNNLTNNSDSNEGSGMQKAKSLASGQPVDHAQLKRMKSFFDNNVGAVKNELGQGKNIYNSGIIQTWNLWGGDAGKRWVEQQISSVQSSNKTSKKIRNPEDGIRTKTLMDPHNTRIHREAYLNDKGELVDDHGAPTELAGDIDSIAPESEDVTFMKMLNKYGASGRFIGGNGFEYWFPENAEEDLNSIGIDWYEKKRADNPEHQDYNKIFLVFTYSPKKL